MSASHGAAPRSRRARSAEDESPVIVTSIAILGAVVLIANTRTAKGTEEVFGSADMPAGDMPESARNPRSKEPWKSVSA